MEAIKERIEEAKDNLLPGGNTHEYDLFLKGMIHGFSEVLEVKPANSIEENLENEHEI